MKLLRIMPLGMNGRREMRDIQEAKGDAVSERSGRGFIPIGTILTL